MGQVYLIGLSLVIGFIFNKFNIPIPWLLGGIISALTLQIAHVKGFYWKRQWRMYALVVVGYGIGRYVDLKVLEQISSEGVGIVSATLIAILACIIVSVIMVKIDHLDLHSVVMGVMPGGFTQMTAMLDEDKRVNANVVTVYQSLRLLVIEMSIPFLILTFLHAKVSANVGSLAVHDGISFWLILPFCFAGAVIFDKLKLSTPYLIGPILVAAIVSLKFGQLDSPPGWLMIIAQMSIGLYVGMGLDIVQLKKLVKTLPVTMVGIFVILAVSMSYADLLSHLYDFDLITGFLAMAPGGIAEMCLTGMSVGANVPVILTYQLFRALFIAFVVPIALKKYFGPPTL
jgi:membrane AbrB-like protein